MSFPDSDVIGRIESRLEFLDGEDHHELCPQHPWNNVCDDADPCECDQLCAEDAAAAAEMRADARREA